MRIKKNVKIVKDRILEVSKIHPEILEEKEPYNLFSYKEFRIENEMKISYVEVYRALQLAKKSKGEKHGSK